MRRSEDQPSRSNRALAVAERTFAACGAAFLVAVIGYIGWYAAAHGDARPELAVGLIKVSPVGQQYAAFFQMTNHGHATAAGVVVEGELRRGDVTIERAETTLDYVPGRSRREGALLFTQDPNAFTLLLSAKGYHDP